ncbi:MAG TPA: ATP-binding cassette domain-containing protein [Ideonella sp.]|nr:ATP-binding cassette domain-containing protein [Ideonella sp.]
MINLKNLTLRRGVKVVLDSASVTLNPGEKVGLVGRNGAGKSSLFSLLAGRLQADGGDFEIPPRWRLGEVVQSMPETDDPATEYVLQGDIPLVEAQALLAAAEAAEDGHAMAEAYVHLEEAGAFDARSRAQTLLLGLGFRRDQLDAPVNSFSGGWRMRLQLARALMCPADLMLLDEPTNHLDLDALVWLEGWLQRYNGTLLIISHDREFLDAITRVTLHLDEAKLTRYGGNYTTFEEMRAERLSQQAAAYGKQQERMAHLQRFIDRFKAKASKAKQAQSRVKALDRMEKLAPVLTASDFTFEFREPLNLPDPMLSLRDMVCGYKSAEPGGADIAIVHNVSRTVMAGQRIGILGANGQGKSTLVKTIARDHPALAGTVTEGKGLAIGYFAQQEMDLLHADDTPMQHMVRLAKTLTTPWREQELRDFLGQFRFVGDMVNQVVGTLSGGEKARLVLASLVWQRPNLLLLDEPTNHLDLTTREALSMALNEFEGSVMLVSHDRALLREVCDEFWLVADGVVKEFDGDLDDYQKWLLDRSREAARALSKAGSPPPPAAAPVVVVKAAAPAPAPIAPREDRKASSQARAKLAEKTKPLRQQVERIDKQLAGLAAERSRLEAELASGKLSGTQLAEHGRRLKQIADDVAAQEERWLGLQDEIEAVTAQGE